MSRMTRALLIVTTIIAGLFLLVGCGSGGDKQITITVNDKERVCESDGECRYLIYTDQGTFKNVDSWLNGKHNSSDIYGSLKRDHIYLVHVEGFRSGILSEYPNIVGIVEEVGPSPKPE